ncbi:anti-CBASS protein Acb1 family protein [Novosphingobium resinovorum]|uniref:Nudix hydrolase domain-containing protein n=1 Tax=Novosphingobium resinovorum TaxID=158500 RepID=A0A1D8A2M9_9SPHN|nr:hypothetical protein BES08_05825 [Novosphingobium resinovorum]
MFDRIRAAWRAFWNGTTAPAAIALPSPAPEDRKPMQVHRAALWEADRGGVQAFDQEALFRALEPMPGVLPEGMAFDAVSPSFDMLAAYGMDQMFHEGLGFLGYPYLAELSQRAEYRKVASIWADHCTRKWIKIHGDDEKVKELTAKLEDLKVRDLFREAIEKECHFGRMQIFVDFGDWNDDIEIAAPLAIRKEKITQKRPLKAIRLVEPMWSYPGVYGSTDPLAPDFYKPKEWYVSGRRVHSSRLLTLVGHDVPNMLKPAYAFGGVSLTQMCKPYVDNWLRTRQAVSDLVNAFSVMVLATDMDQVLQANLTATQNLYQRLDVFNATRDNRGIFALNKNSEEFSNVSAPIAGLHELQAQSQEQMSSVSSIPLVILLGITPKGLNASSEGEFRVFYDAILGYNEKVVADPLRKIIDMVQLSLWGDIDPEITFEFESLWEMSDKDKADIRKSDADAAAIYLEHGVVDAEEERERLRNDETSMYHGVNLEGAAPEDNDEDTEGEGDEDEVTGAQDARTAHAAGVMCTLPDGRMLFLRRSDDSDRHPGKWCWPGGKIDAGEDAYEAAMRELFEETGFDDVMLGLPVDVRDGFITFRADLSAPFDPELNGEHTAAVWAHPLDVPGQLHPGVAATLKAM